MNQASDALNLAEAIASQLAAPERTTADADAGWPQSLAKGAAGIALLHIERARTGLTGWDTAHAWLQAAASAGVSAGSGTGLFFGAPAVAFAVRAAGEGRYTRALIELDSHVAALAHRRASQAQARIRRGSLPALAEFDLMYGLSGIGAYLLRHAPHDDALEHVLHYLVELTKPLRIDGQTLPGWWTSHDPSFTSSPGFAGGHANFGMAHGVAGPLALLALALRRSAVVDGHADAIERICSWLDAWRQDGGTGPWWPQWITREELRTCRPTQSGPLRPSWCYGSPGLARAQQLAGIATGDIARQNMAEQALTGCLSDPAQLNRITDTSLCHGWVGLFQTVWRIARDARTPAITACLAYVTERLIQHGRHGPSQGAGFLEGDAGLALGLHTAARPTPPESRWDTCLLIG